MYVILASKPGEFHTELGAGLHPIEAFDYIFFGREVAHYVIARLEGEPRISIVDERAPALVCRVPSKFLPKFDSVDAARCELDSLTHAFPADAVLRPVTITP